MITFDEFLVEALVDISREDINKIYSPLSKFISELAEIIETYPYSWGSGIIDEIISKYSKTPNLPVKSFNSSVFKSKQAQIAHQSNPITVEVYLHNNRCNSYSPKESKIYIGLTDNLVNFLRTVAYTKNNQEYIKHKNSLFNDINDVKLKSTIRHELTHWIDDSLHNKHISKLIVSPSFREKVNQGLANGIDVRYEMPHEITAIVNQIAEIKRRIGDKKYNLLTWVDILEKVPGLKIINDELGVSWRRVIFSRLARENLIGAKFTSKLKN
jgi:hypothetical protein